MIRLGAFGDVVDTLPSIQALRSQWADTHITFITKEPMAPLVSQFAHEVVPYPGHFSSLPAFTGRLLRRSFDVVLDFHGNLRSALIAQLPQSPVISGFCKGISREGASKFYTRIHDPTEGVRSRLDRGLSLVSALTGNISPYQVMTFPIHPQHAARAAKLTREGHDIALVPGTSLKGRYKSWPMERWERFVTRADSAWRFLVVTGPGDLVSPALLSNPRCRPVRCTTVLEMLEVLRACRAVVGADTGPMHLAHLLSKPTLVLFGPKDPSYYGPQYNRHRSIWHRQVCGPCHNWRCDHVSCMWSISTGEVASALSELVEDR